MTTAGPNVERRARFHYNASRPDEPWHIRVHFSNRSAWDNGNGFFRGAYHIYAKNDDLSQGYAGYSSPMTRSAIGMIDPPKHREYLPIPGRNDAEPGTSTSSANTEANAWIPWGKRVHFRNPIFRGFLHKTTHHCLEPPTALSESQARRTPWMSSRYPITGVSEGKPRPSLQDDFDDMISSIHDGTLKPASPAKGGFMIPDLSGNWVHLRQAVSEAKLAGKEIPLAWKVYIAEKLRASRRRLRENARPLSATRAQSAVRQSRRTTRPTTQSREGALKSEAAKPRSRTKLTIRDPFDTDAGISQGVSAPSQRSSGAIREKGPRRWPEDGKFEPKGRFRRILKRPRVGTKDADLGKALLNAVPEPEVSIDHRQGPKASRPPSGEVSTQPRPRRYQRSSLGKLFLNLGNAVLNLGNPVSGESGRSPPALDSRNRKPKESRAQKRGSDTHKAGKQTSSPLPPADADFVSEGGEKTKGPYKGQRSKQRRALKTTPAWVLPRTAKEATSDELHA